MYKVVKKDILASFLTQDNLNERWWRHSTGELCAFELEYVSSDF